MAPDPDNHMLDMSAPHDDPLPDLEDVRMDDLDELDELIHHDKWRAEVREVLEDREAGHDRRVWLAGFLTDAVGLSVEETTDLICRLARWDNLDRETTRKQVWSVVRSDGGRSR
jgi:hypothetical protein